jgi:phosphate transport system substrate-binding protein
VKKTADSPAVEPTEETVKNGSYPIWRYLYNYLNPDKDKGEIHAYLNWIRGPEGQNMVGEVGYYSLPQDLQQK